MSATNREISRENDRLSDIANEFERALNAGELAFSPCDLATLPASTRKYIECFLLESGIKYSLCDRVIEGSYLFKLDDPVVGFLHHDSVTEIHMWADAGFTEGLNPSAVFWYLMCRKVALGEFSNV